jgi:hypothetical protein
MALLAPALAIGATLAFSGALAWGAMSGSLGWTRQWWPWLLLAAAWLPAALRRARATWRAWRIVRGMRSGNRTVAQLARALVRFPEVDLAGQPLPPWATPAWW